MPQLPLTAAQYRAVRSRIGTQQLVADHLAVDRTTVARRETGGLPVTPEASLAILALDAGRLMKTAYYQTSAGPAEAVYGHFLDYSAAVPRVVVVVCGDVLWNSDAGRDAMLNRIMDHELSGVRTEFIRFVVVVGHTSSQPIGKEFDIIPDLDEYERRGHPLKKKGLRREREYSSIHMVGGATVYRTEFERGHVLPEAETLGMLRKAGILASP